MTTNYVATEASPVREAATASTHRLASIVFGVALLCRIVIVCWLNFVPKQYRPFMPIFANDALTYDGIARSLVAGTGYQWNGNSLEITSIPPLFPVWLSILYRLGLSSTAAIGFTNALLGALTAVLLFYLVREAFAARQGTEEPASQETARRAEWIALAAALIFAVYPFELFNTPFVLKENFSIFLVASFVFGWIRLWSVGTSPQTWKWAVYTGIALGLSVLSRYPHQGFIVVFLLFNFYWMWKLSKTRQTPPGIRSGTAIVLVTSLLTISPWLVRNYRVFGQLTLSANGPAHALYNANSPLSEPETNGYFEGHGDKRLEYNRKFYEQTKGNPNLRESIYRREVVKGVLSDPGKVLLLMKAKLISMWRPVWTGSSIRTWLMLGIPYLIMMVLALPGMVLAYRRRTDFAVAFNVLYTMIFFYFLGHLVFYGMIRERQYVEPYLMVFAAYSLWLLFGSSRVRPAAAKNFGMPQGSAAK